MSDFLLPRPPNTETYRKFAYPPPPLKNSDITFVQIGSGHGLRTDQRELFSKIGNFWAWADKLGRLSIPHVKHNIGRRRRRRRLAAPQAQREEVKVHMGGGRFDSSTIGNKQIEVTALRGVPDLFRACIASRGPPRATPIRPGGQRTRLSRGPVHQRSRSSRCSLRGRRRQQTNKGPVTKIFGGLCYIVSTTYMK